MELHRSEQVSVAHDSFIEVEYSALFPHEGEMRQKILDLKYGGCRSLARELATFLSEEIMQNCSVDVMTWAPTSAGRIRERGFDHAELLARHVGASSKVRCQRLLRRLDTQHQTGQPRDIRLLQPRFLARPLGRYKRVCVIDDVMTTRATMRAAAQALGQMGAQHVLCVAVTFVPENSELDLVLPEIG